jgi:hypothetical protein
VAGRPERPLPVTGPVAEFANEVRTLRKKSGLTYEQLAIKTHYSKSAVHEATRGRQLPTVMVGVPGATEAGLASWLFWGGRSRSLWWSRS